MKHHCWNILKIHQDTTDYSYIVDVAVFIRDLRQRKKLALVLPVLDTTRTWHTKKSIWKVPQPNKSVYWHHYWKSTIKLTFFVFLVLEQLLGAELENVVELLFGHHRALVAESRPHDQMRQHHLALGHLRDSLLHRVACHEAVDQNTVRLTDAMRTTERLHCKANTRSRTRLCSNSRSTHHRLRANTAQSRQKLTEERSRSHRKTWFIIVRRSNPREERLWESKMDWLLKTEEATVGYEDLKMLAQVRSSWSQWRW